MTKICIIDDEKSICESLQWILQKEGYNVKYETNFDSAIELIKRERFDLFFVDLVLPGGSGIDIIKEIDQNKQDGKIIIITGYPSTPTLIDSVRLQVYDYLSKPIDPLKIKEIAELALKDELKGKKEDSNE